MLRTSLVRLALLALLVDVVAVLVGCRTQSRPEVVVYAAASTTNALDEIRAEFSKQTGVEVKANYAASSTLAQQIAGGADADLFLSADVKWADFVADKTATARRRRLLGNRLVIVVPTDSSLRLDKPEDLAQSGVQHLAIASPESVPAGRYAKQALTTLGIWEQVKRKVAPAEDVRHALMYVETGAAEVGVVYATDAAMSTRVKVAVEIPAGLAEPVRYPVVLLKRDPENAAAMSFYEYLAGGRASEVFRKCGFIVLPEGEISEK